MLNISIAELKEKNVYEKFIELLVEDAKSNGVTMTTEDAKSLYDDTETVFLDNPSVETLGLESA